MKTSIIWQCPKCGAFVSGWRPCSSCGYYKR
jgi:ribosomal protein L32